MPRKKEDKEIFLARLSPEAKRKIQEIALNLGYTYAGEGSQSKLLEAIASGELILIKAIKKTS